MPETKNSFQFCPVHSQPFSGDPYRCLVCEPDQVAAVFVYKTKLTAEQAHNMTDEQGRWFNDHLAVRAAQLKAARN